MSEFDNDNGGEMANDDLMGSIEDNEFINQFLVPDEKPKVEPETKKTVPKTSTKIPKEVMAMLEEQKKTNAILQSKLAQLEAQQIVNSGEIVRTRNIRAVKGIDEDIDKVVNNEDNRRIFGAMGKPNEVRNILVKAIEEVFDRTKIMPEPQSVMDSLIAPYLTRSFLEREDRKNENSGDIYGLGKDNRSELIGKHRDLRTESGVEEKEEDIRREYMRKIG